MIIKRRLIKFKGDQSKERSDNFESQMKAEELITLTLMISSIVLLLGLQLFGFNPFIKM